MMVKQQMTDNIFSLASLKVSAVLLMCFLFFSLITKASAASDVAIANEVSTASEVDAYPFDNAEREERFWSLLTALRCPTCQNQSLADSDAVMAKSLRQSTYEQVKAGNSDDEIIAFMTDRYGDFISYKPRVNEYTVWLWLIPLWAFVLGLYFVLRQFNPKPEKAADDAC